LAWTWKKLGGFGGACAVLAVGITIAEPLQGGPRRARSVLPIETATTGDEIVAGRVLLRLRRNLPADLVAGLQHCGVGVEDRLEGGVDVLTVPPVAPADLIAWAFEQLDEVEFCEPDGIVRNEGDVDDPDAVNQWHLTKIGVRDAWTLSEGSADTTIAVLDSGVDPNHPDLAGKLVPGWNFIRGNANTIDDYGHGTHVAGLAAATTNNGVGVAGVGYRCSILPLKVLDSSGTGSYSAVAAAIRYASLHGARVINLSLGGSVPSATLQASVDAAVERGCVVIAAAGNAGSTDRHYPAACPNAIAVGASTPADLRASFTNYGPWVDLAAPGTNLLSSYPTYPVSMGSGGMYRLMSGTSMSTPVVSGVAGLLFTLLGSSATPAAVRACLESTADPVAAGWTAFGRLDAAAALARASRPFAPRTGNPANVSVTVGRFKSGDLTGLVAVDDLAFEVSSDGVRGRRHAEVEIDVNGLSGALSSLLVNVASRSSAYGRQRVSFYDWAAAQFVEFDSSVVRSKESTRRIDLSTQAATYVRGGLLRLRIHMQAGVAFVGSVDAVSATAMAN
jgi:thermitase